METTKSKEQLREKKDQNAELYGKDKRKKKKVRNVR